MGYRKDISIITTSQTFCIDRNQALQVVARLAGKKEYESANEMLGIVERSIKEDRAKLTTTNMVRFRNMEEYKVFEHAQQKAKENV